MHAENPYQAPYDFTKYTEVYAPLKNYIVLNTSGQETIDFSDSNAVYALNKAILLTDYKLQDYILPKGYLIPPVPGRLDYLLYIKDFLSERFNLNIDRPLKGLDIGSGANSIYCLLGSEHFGWSMVGAESDVKAVEIAKENIARTPALKNTIEIRLQENKQFLFKNIVQPN
jgi:23S rRNA (adenine1618-N6)-methyltransferase